MKRIEDQSGFQWAAQVLKEGSRNEKENFLLAEAPAAGRKPFPLAEAPAAGRKPFPLAECPGHWRRINGTNKCAGMQQRKEVRFITNNISFKRQLC